MTTKIDKKTVERLGNWLALNARPEHIDAAIRSGDEERQ
jgi:hypothetical protein